ncbi:Two-component response regulator [Labilithrix luteola]|uniref:Two-component response regulator n=1 Tax=Labilithrix luteola TaxID=1391654 RepID=A0A0K1Q4F6_9BACT|nr:helix-turn-helix domain-containing protein [Labilithrix luteola]AKV00260.1 Two-component response regulator [Labilithrix luteola]
MDREARATHKLNAALAEFYSPGLAADTFVDRAFALASRLVSSSLNTVGVLGRDKGALSANFDHTPPGLEDAFTAFGVHMGKYTPFRFDPTVNDGKPFSARDFFSRSAFDDLDIYQEVYRPLGLADHCFVHVPTAPDTVVFLGLLRDGRPFDRAEKELLGLIQPHLSNGRKLALAVTAAENAPLAPELFAAVGFTPRESDVLYWLTRGKSNDEIAKILRMRADSVSRHLHTIYEKMGVEHRVAATIGAVELARKLRAESLSVRGGGILLTVPRAR